MTQIPWLTRWQIIIFMMISAGDVRSVWVIFRLVVI